MVTETKDAPKVSNKKKDEIIYIDPNIKESYVAFFSKPGGELAAELINSIVALIKEIYEPEHCSLEPVETQGNTLRLKLKILRPEVRLTSENGLFITLRRFYTEHVLKIVLQHEDTISLTVLKNIKGCLLSPTLAQATASFAHSHLHSTGYGCGSAYDPNTFCLGSSSLSNSLYGDPSISKHRKERDILSALKHVGKILHFTESLVHHESISGTPYNYIKGVIEKTWERCENSDNVNLRSYFKKAYHKCMVAIYKDVLENARLPFTFGPPSNTDIFALMPHGNNYMEAYMPTIHTDTGFRESIKSLIVPIIAGIGDSNKTSKVYKFNNKSFSGQFKHYPSQKLRSPDSVWKGLIDTTFKGKNLRVGYNGITSDDETHQTYPEPIETGKDSGDTHINFITDYMVRSFDEAFKELILVIMSSFKRGHLLETWRFSPQNRIVPMRHSTNSHFSTILEILRAPETKAQMTEIIIVLSTLIRSTINFNNFNHFMNEQ